MQSIERSFDDFAHIHQHVPAIQDLLSLRRSQTCASGKLFGAIAADPLDPWMALEPPCKGLGTAIRQQFHRPMRQQIDDNGAIGVTTPKRLGKGNGVTAIPSPKNRAGMFPCTRLKPFMTPV